MELNTTDSYSTESSSSSLLLLSLSSSSPSQLHLPSNVAYFLTEPPSSSSAPSSNLSMILVHLARHPPGRPDFVQCGSEWKQLLSCVLVVYVEPILCVIGFLLNIACIVVFLSVSSNGYFRKTSLLFYLAALTFCNSMQLLLSVFTIILPAMEQFIAYEYPAELERLTWLNARTIRFCYPLMMTANYAAIWLLLLICAQRFQAICHPSSPWKKRLSPIRRSRVSVAAVVLSALGLNVIRFWELEWNDEMQLVSTGLRENTLYRILQEGIGYGIIVYCVPMLFLLWLNLNICQLIRNHQIHVQSSSRRPAEYRTALMTVCVFVFFAFCATLSASIRLPLIVAGAAWRESLQWLVDVSNLLMNINALVTPILYFVFTRAFRDLFVVIRFKHGAGVGALSSSPIAGPPSGFPSPYHRHSGCSLQPHKTSYTEDEEREMSTQLLHSPMNGENEENS